MVLNLKKIFSGREEPEKPDFSRLPRHIAIIMDGNGRWAVARGMPRSAGHRAGSENFRRIATHCNDIGIEYLTVYAFSTENWIRPKQEINVIMDLLREYLLEACEKIRRDNISLRIIGDQSPLSDELRSIIARTAELSVGTTGLKVNVCLNYGGRAEIIHAARALAKEAAAGRIDPSAIDEDAFAKRLDMREIPDPDLIIRPSGEIRISNFLLWESAYSEYYFTKSLWPDFTVEELDRAICSYQKRSRRFGGVDDKTYKGGTK